jgi:4'-phosphopantetheinyl transferase EntD
MPEEAAACDAFRAQRLAEFAAGRQCARRALEDLRFGGLPVRRNADRTPCWPQRVVGSITHTVGFAGAVAAPAGRFAGLGVDAEIVARVTDDLWAQAFTPDECAAFARLGRELRARVAAVTFSAKEALYKCQYGVTGRWLDYRDVGVEIGPEKGGGGEFLARPATSNGRLVLRDFAARGRYQIDAELVVTGVALTSQAVRSLPPRERQAAA